MPLYEMPGPKVIEKFLSYGENYWRQQGFLDACQFFYGEVYAGRVIMDADLAKEGEPNATH